MFKPLKEIAQNIDKLAIKREELEFSLSLLFRREKPTDEELTKMEKIEIEIDKINEQLHNLNIKLDVN